MRGPTVTDEEKDLTGLDVFATPFPPEKPDVTPRSASMHQLPQNHQTTPPITPRSENQAHPHRTYNLNEVAIRWSTTRYRVEQQISAGMNMKKLPNGRWSITEYDLLAWEKRIARKKKITLAISLVIILLAVLAIAIVWMRFLNPSESGSLSPSSTPPQSLTETTTQSPGLPASNPYYSLDTEYIFPDSASRLISRQEIESLNEVECMIARNEIAARHGRSFIDSNLQEYFDSKPWYHSELSPEEYDENTETLLNETEHANSALIRNVEDEKGYNQ